MWLAGNFTVTLGLETDTKGFEQCIGRHGDGMKKLTEKRAKILTQVVRAAEPERTLSAYDSGYERGYLDALEDFANAAEKSSVSEALQNVGN